MSKNYEITPIIIKNNNKYYRIANIIFSSDNSIYFVFPSKNRKRIISDYYEKKYNDKEYSEYKLTLKSFQSESLEPKVSFHSVNAQHPNSMVVHINSNKVGDIINNMKVLNVGHDNDIFIYLMQVIVPKDLSFFDEYINEHSKYIEIDSQELNDETLSLEFVIHSTGISQEDYCLPYSKNRVLRGIFTFITLNNLTCSMAVSTLRGSKNCSDSGGLLLSINTNEKLCLCKIINKEEK